MTIVLAAYVPMQFIEVDLPHGVDPEEYSDTQDFRDEVADRIRAGDIGFSLERRFDEKGNEV